MRLFICVIAMVMILEGLPYFIAPEKMQNMLRIISGMPSATMRRMGLILILAGLLLLCIGKRYV